MKALLLLKSIGLSLAIGGSLNVAWAADVTGDRLNIGTGHSLSGSWATIAGGVSNTNGGPGGVISGGQQNTIHASPFTDASLYCTIGGGVLNTIHSNAYRSVIAGGADNVIEVDAHRSTIGGGDLNVIEEDSYASVISGGVEGVIRGYSAYSSISGGGGNIIGTNASYAWIGGGWKNFIVGSTTNNPVLNVAVIGGGWTNHIGLNGVMCVIGGGNQNAISSDANSTVIAGGSLNTAAGLGSTVPGGQGNAAIASYTFAAGRRAKATHTGSFVWGDSTDADVGSTTNNEVTFRCNGGTRFLGTGGGGNQTVSWKPGDASWTFSSDRNLKEKFTGIDRRAILEKITSLPLNEWSFKGHDKRHIGPMAQDFHACFGLGGSETTIDSADLQGVSIAAIQGLNEKIEERLGDLQIQLESRDSRIQYLEKQLAELKKLVMQSSE